MARHGIRFPVRLCGPPASRELLRRFAAALISAWTGLLASGCAVSHTDTATGKQTVLGLSRSEVTVSPIDSGTSYVTTSRRVPGLHVGFGSRRIGLGIGLDDDQTGWVVGNDVTNDLIRPSGGWAIGGKSGGKWRLGLTRLQGVPGTRSRQVFITGRAAVGVSLRMGDAANSILVGAAGFQTTQIAADRVALEAQAVEPPSLLPAIDRISFSPFQTNPTPPTTSQ